MRSPKVSNHEILGALSTYKKALVYEKSKFFSKAKVGTLWHPDHINYKLGCALCKILTFILKETQLDSHF